jgi:hypothetical protein
MEAALEAANPAKTSRREIGVIPFLCLVRFRLSRAIQRRKNAYLGWVLNHSASATAFGFSPVLR